MRPKILLEGSSDHSSDASTVSDFGEFGAGFHSSANQSGHGEAEVYDVDQLRAKNLQLKKELKRAQKEYDDQGANMHLVTRRKQELVYKSLPPDPYTLAWHISPRGLEFTQVYFWIIRDALWMQQDGDAAMALGGLCIACAAVSVFVASYAHRKTLTTSTELFHAIARLLWIVGMFVWMDTSVYDLEGNTAGDIYTPKGSPGRFIGTCVLVVALIVQFSVIASRFLAFKVVSCPDQCIPVSQAVQMKPFEEPRLRARYYLLFGSYRDWELAELFLWIGKDTAASQQLGGWWVIFYIFIYCVTVFKLTVSLNTRKAMVDHLHYICIAFWLLGNFIFQLSHLYLKYYDHNSWEYLYPRHQTSEYVGNFQANVLVLLAFVPVGVLYTVWLTATLFGWIRVDPDEVVAWDVPVAELVRPSLGHVRFCRSTLFNTLLLPHPAPPNRTSTAKKHIPRVLRNLTALKKTGSVSPPDCLRLIVYPPFDTFPQPTLTIPFPSHTPSAANKNKHLPV